MRQTRRAAFFLKKLASAFHYYLNSDLLNRRDPFRQEWSAEIFARAEGTKKIICVCFFFYTANAITNLKSLDDFKKSYENFCKFFLSSEIFENFGLDKLKRSQNSEL